MRIAVVILAALALSACTAPKPDKVVARVGARSITERDAAFRDAIWRLENPEDKRSLGVVQLCQAYELAETLRRYGRPVTDAAIEAEARRIEQNTKNPEGLRRIRALFHGDEAVYRRVYVLPALVGRVVPYEFFPEDPAVQGEIRLRAERFLASVRREPSTFVAAGKIADEQRAFGVSVADGLRWDPPPAMRHEKSLGDKAEGQRWLQEVVPTLRPGEVFGRVIDVANRWVVVRYRGLTHGVHRFDAALFSKGNFSVWLEKELASTPDARCVAPFTAPSR